MKINEKAKLGLLLFALLALLSGCENQAADIEAITLEHSPDGFTRVSLRADSTEAAVSGNLDGTMHYGESITLSAAPFFQDEIFYFPLNDVIPLLGGTCQIEGGTAQVHIYDRDLIFQVGSPDVLVDGITCRGYPQSDRSPQIVNGVYYIPQGLEVYGEPAVIEGPLGRVYPEQSVVILTESSYFNCELCAAGAWLEEPFDTIPASVRQTLRPAGCEQINASYTAECFEGDSIRLWVAHPIQEGEDPDGMEGYVVRIQLTGDRYPTWRGLRVGDTRDRAEFLYGDVDGSLFSGYSYEIVLDETDHVSSIQLSPLPFAR